MLGYITLGSNDLEKALNFYDALLGSIGCKRLMDYGTFVAWGKSIDEPLLAITKPYDGNAASVGNGVMIAIKLPTKEAVDAFHQKALELGGTDEGPVGNRGEGFYTGYFRDPDGNKLNAYIIG